MNTISMMLEAAGQYDLLTTEQEQSLARKVQAGDKRAADKLALHNQRLAISIAKTFHNAEVGLEDRIQQGYIGVLDAVARFQPGLGKFSTFAVPHIKNAIRRYIHNHDLVRIPVNQQDGRHELSEAAANFRDMLRLEAENGNSDGGVLADVLGANDDALGDVDFRAMLECLSSDEADVITRRYVLNETLAEIGEARGGVSRQRIDQIHKVALGKLREAVAA
jgi:RNA polymerase sigma factor (sigma-70 family)